MKKIIVILFILIASISYSQEKNYNQEAIVKTYSTELKLNSNQTKKLSSILSSYKNKLYDEDLSPSQFNATLKLQTLEIYELLSKNQFSSYLKLRTKHQPELTYRFN